MDFAVYVPVDNVLGIDPGSGVVGRARDGRVELYYEGNRFRFVNVVTFADRVGIAAERMRDSYPTIARGLVDADKVELVGHYAQDAVAPFKVVDVLPEHRPQLAAWLGVEDGGLDAELSRSRP